jgi:hypothetical protein
VLKAIGRAVLKAAGLYEGFVLTRHGPLAEDGWVRSFRAGTPMDADGRPLPWLAYPAIDFLKRRVRPEMIVFEYGSGASTLWWANRVQEVVSCEHDREWYERLLPLVPKNVTLRHAPLQRGGEYCRVVAEQPGRYDIVVIDGRDRVNCAAHAPEGLTPGGVIVWDNTNRGEYAEGMRGLEARGFRALAFTGLAPVMPDRTETTVFYRDRNCLEL